MSGRERGVLRMKQVPKRQRMDLRHVPGAENAEVEYKRSDPRAVVLGEIYNIAEDHDELYDARNSEKDANHCTSHQKHKGSNSPANHGKSTYKENYSANTLTNGAIYRRSLDKDLRDASKTPSSRLARGKTRSNTYSPKQSSQSHQDHARRHATDDEPDDEDCIKPVSLSAKRSNKIYSDSDSDDSLPSIESPSSTGKRKGSDTDGDDEDDGQDKNKSSKKKFKRTKRNVTSPQETRKSVDTTEKKRVGTKKTDGDQDSNRSSSCSSSSGSNTDSSDSNISDTNSYHSGDDDSDDQLVEEGPLEGRNYIEELREELGDDDGTLDLLRHYIRWFALKAGGENVDDNIYKETVDAKKRLDGRLEVFIDICQSQAWGPNFRADVMKYPKFVDYIKREDLEGGDMRYLGNCQVCNRESHPWSEIVKLKGDPYNRDTFEMIASEDEEDCVELPPVEYYMGRFCHLRSKLYHKLYHFGYHLYQRCKEMMEELVDDDDRIDTVATDMSLLREMYTKLKKWMNKAEKDYTTKNGERTNNKWAREYVLI